MSISKLRSATEKKGCQTLVWIVMVGAAVSLSFTGFRGCAKGGQAGQEGQQIVIATIEGHDLTAAQVEEQVRQLQANFGPVSDPYLDFQYRAAAVRTAIASQVVNSLAASRGVVIDDARAIALMSDELDKSILQYRQQATAAKELNPGATEQEFQDFFKKKEGLTTSELKNRQIEEVKKTLADPLKREGFLASFYQQALLDNYYAATSVTEQDVKDSYLTFMTKSIAFDKQSETEAQRKARADAALVEIKGGADFDAVMKKNMEAPATTPIPITGQQIAGDASLSVLRTLKPGQVTEVVTTFGIPRIHKLVEVKNDIPKDFETSKALYSDSYRRTKASNDMRKAVQDATKAAKIEWKSVGYELLNRTAEAATDPTFNDEAIKQVYLKVIETKTDAEKDPAGVYPASLAHYMAAENLSLILKGQELTDFYPKYEQVILDILATSESIDLRLKLVDLYEKMGNNAAIALSLKTAASLNSGFEVQNQAYFDRINRKLTELENAKKLTAAEAKDVRDVLVKWSQDKAAAEASQKQQTSDLDEFTIDPVTGKPLKDAAKDTAEKAKEKADAPTGG